MFKTKHFTYPFLIWILLIFWYFLFFYGFSQSLRLRFQDFVFAHSFYLFGQSPQEAEDIVIVTIDEESRARLEQRWPWQRDVTAAMIETIASYSPRVIGCDIIFSGITDPVQDRALAEVFEKSSNVVLGYILREETSEMPLSIFCDAVWSLGFVNRPYGIEQLNIQEDHSDVYKVVRYIRTFYPRKNASADVSIDIAVVAKYLGIRQDEISVDYQRGISLGDKIFIPSPGGITPLNYTVYPSKFKFIPAYRVLAGDVNISDFQNKIVLVGATDPLIHDEHLTPLGMYPGVTIIANSVVMILSGRFLAIFPQLYMLFPFFLLGTGIILINKNWGFISATISTIGILMLLFVSALFLRAHDIQFDYFTLFFFCVSAYVVVNTHKYSYLIYMRNRLRNLAVIDPLTKFYTYRYFLVKVDEEFKDRSKNMLFCAFRLRNYNKIAFDFQFDQLQSLIQIFTHYLRVQLEKHFKKIMFFRLAQDIIGVTVTDVDRGLTESVIRDVMDESKKVEFEMNRIKMKMDLQTICVFKAKGQRLKSKELLATMERVLARSSDLQDKDFIFTQVEERIWEKDERHKGEDIMDFLEVDLEERNKELEKMVEELIETKKDVERSYLEVVRCLIKALEQKDTYTEGHSERVARYSIALAKEAGWPQEECDLLYKAALLHDIGKIGIPDHILHKKERLTDEDYALIKRHPLTGVDILKPFKPFENLLSIILYHHERWDGTGYPHGISADKIPKGAQIMAIADSYDAITCGRGYKKGDAPGEALQEIIKNSGTQFSPHYVEIFQRVFQNNPADF
ncbi:MAG: CHASE2 domain-containing protein [Candidatus Omnitrophica bacterium]|nr:CHASE2 domain-containing protein [Candidatus Omnitrophota bacterium]